MIKLHLFDADSPRRSPRVSDSLADSLARRKGEQSGAERTRDYTRVICAGWRQKALRNFPRPNKRGEAAPRAAKGRNQCWAGRGGQSDCRGHARPCRLSKQAVILSGQKPFVASRRVEAAGSRGRVSHITPSTPSRDGLRAGNSALGRGVGLAAYAVRTTSRGSLQCTRMLFHLPHPMNESQ